MSDTSYGQAMLRFLSARASIGATAAEIKAHTRGTMQCYIQRYTAAGMIGYVDEPAKRPRGAQVLRRYWLREHCPPGAVLEPVNRGVRVRKVKAPADAQSAPKLKPKPPLASSPEFAAAPQRITARTKVTVWTPRPDPRAAKIQPAPPLFGTLEQGRRPEPRAWAEAAAGGAR